MITNIEPIISLNNSKKFRNNEMNKKNIVKKGKTNSDKFQTILNRELNKNQNMCKKQ